MTRRFMEMMTQGQRAQFVFLWNEHNCANHKATMDTAERLLIDNWLFILDDVVHVHVPWPKDGVPKYGPPRTKFTIDLNRDEQ